MKEDISRICKQFKECVTEWIDRLIEKAERKKRRNVVKTNGFIKQKEWRKRLIKNTDRFQ